MKKLMLFSSIILSIALCSCGSGSSSSSSSEISSSSIESSSEVSSVSSSKREIENPADVFILIGQSNMEGNTTYDNFPKYCTAKGLDKNTYYNGFKDINISFRNHYSNAANNSSNPSNPDEYKYVPVKLGMGGESKYFGPEVGMAERLSKEKLARPLYMIKYCSGGTGFTTQTRDGIANWDWQSPSSTKTPGVLYTGLLSYVANCMAGIEEAGYTPVLKGILWMQGERDGCFEIMAKAYYKFLNKFVLDLREDLKQYSIDGAGDSITFIDSYIYEGPSEWIYYQYVNDGKLKFNQKDSNSYLLDITAKGLNLTIKSEDGFGGGDQYHFNISSMMDLGRGFANIIIDNGLID